MTSKRSSGKGKNLVRVFGNLVWTSKNLNPTFPCFSEQLHCVQPKDIPSLLQTGVAVYSSEGLELPLKDANVLRLITPQQPYESMNKPQLSFLTSSVPVLKASLQTWFYPKGRLRWLSLPKKSKFGSNVIKDKPSKWAQILKVMLTILLVLALPIVLVQGTLFLLVVLAVIIGTSL